MQIAEDDKVCDRSSRRSHTPARPQQDNIYGTCSPSCSRQRLYQSPLCIFEPDDIDFLHTSWRPLQSLNTNHHGNKQIVNRAARIGSSPFSLKVVSLKALHFWTLAWWDWTRLHICFIGIYTIIFQSVYGLPSCHTIATWWFLDKFPHTSSPCSGMQTPFMCLPSTQVSPWPHFMCGLRTR